MRNQSALDAIAIILLIIGGLNWGIIGLLKFDPIDAIFGADISAVIFTVIGFAAVYRAGLWVANRVK